MTLHTRVIWEELEFFTGYPRLVSGFQEIQIFGGGVFLLSTNTNIFFPKGIKLSTNTPDRILYDSDRFHGDVYIGPTDNCGVSGFGLTHINLDKGWKLEAAPLDVTDIFAGFRILMPDGFHFGWVKLSRPNANFKSQWEIVDSALNPDPDQSIEVGNPPRPSLRTEITENGLVLRSSMPAPNYRLEYSESLDAQAVWTGIPLVDGASAPIAPRLKQQFFRLREIQ